MELFFIHMTTKDFRDQLRKRKRKEKGEYFLQLSSLGKSRQTVQIRLILVCFLLPIGFQNTIVGLTDYVSREQEYQDWPGLGQKKTVL